MTVNHSVSELVSCIKNGQMARKDRISCGLSKTKEKLLKLLKQEGYVKNYSVEKKDGGFERLNVELSYHDNQPVVKDIKVISKPGCRVYCKAADIPKVYDGLGMVFLSTPKGILTDYDARKLNVGGELLLKIF